MVEIISEDQKLDWRNEYLLKRYLIFLSLKDLKERLNDILLNMLSFSEEGSICFDQSNYMSGLIQRLIHLEVEMLQRGYSIDLDKKANKYKIKYPNILKAIKAWNAHKPKLGYYLVKYSKKEFLTQMKNCGKIRVNPASFYTDKSLNIAIQDQELNQTIILPKGSKLNKIMPSGERKKIKGIQKLSVSRTYPSNFYIFCMTKYYQHRLFDDFNADACLLIYDFEKFSSKFLECLKKSYPDWQLKSGDISYYDPYFPPFSTDIPFNKHFRYQYQNEFRISFKSKDFIEKLESIDLEIGSLNDCSELILL